MQKINLLEAAAALAPGEYGPAGECNGQALTVLTAENRTLEFHVHEQSDELFYVLEGRFWLETARGLTEVNAGELIVVPKGTPHRPVVHERSRFLLMERAGTLTNENTGGGLG